MHILIPTGPVLHNMMSVCVRLQTQLGSGRFPALTDQTQ